MEFTVAQAIGLGCAGGLLPDVLRLVDGRYGPPPEYLGRAIFWTSLVILTLIGGLAAYLVQPASVAEALAVGFSAPEILSKLLRREPTPPSALPPNASAAAKPTSLRAWWSA